MKMDKGEIVVVGAGPAGLSAAAEAANLGCEVTLFDENRKAGGQLFKQIHKFFGSHDHKAGLRGFQIAAQLGGIAAGAGVRLNLESTVFGIFEDNIIGYASEGRAHSIAADAIVLATGAKENSIVFPGWTLPGVMSAGAAQTMVNVHRVLPGRKILMVGSGNVGLIVSYQLLQAGAEVVAVVEKKSRIGGYEVHCRKLRSYGVKILTSCTIKQALGDRSLQYAEIGKVDGTGKILPGSEMILQVDAICLAVGLSPLAELAWMAGCRCIYLPELGGYVPLHDAEMESSKKGLFVAGDISGIEEASTAMEEGRLAGISAAKRLGRATELQISKERKEIEERLSQLRHGPFGAGRYRAKQKIMAASTHKPKLDQSVGSFRKTDRQSKRLKKTKTRCWLPSQKRLSKGPVAVIECMEEIPCDPCKSICPEEAIRITGPLSNAPVFLEDRCNGCRLCVSCCPGLAIFVVDFTYSDEQAVMHFPYEFLSLPSAGAQVDAVNRHGAVIGKAKVQAVHNVAKYNKTAVVSVVVPKNIAMDVGSVRVAPEGKIPDPRPNENRQKAVGAGKSRLSTLDAESRSLIVCRCEEITDVEMKQAVEKNAASLREMKNRTRAGMGLCQARACADMSLRLLTEVTGVSPQTSAPPQVRPPVRPIELGNLAEGAEDD
jgi:NADPH-dependent 2,4-dienoyl-CoA reductase/sulfur reductase-like enzyme/Fe-S-cluster-containing hydrogenase component 2/bacterioferritin-associated ferredoxin